MGRLEVLRQQVHRRATAVTQREYLQAEGNTYLAHYESGEDRQWRLGGVAYILQR